MKISDLELMLVEPQGCAGRRRAPSLLLCLTADSGREGWGEAPLRWRPAELADRHRALLSALASRSVFDIEELAELAIAGDPLLASALEMASWDLIGQSAGQPLCHLMGGAYRQRIPLAVRLPPRKGADLRSVARELADQGFHSQIVTAEGDAASDAAAACEAAEAAGERAEVQLDGAGRYRLSTARELCSRLSEQHVSLLLDPIGEPDMDTVASLARQTNIPLGLSSPIHGPRDVMAAVRSGAAAHIVVDIHQVGGLLAARRCAAVAEAGGLSVSLAAERSVGVAVAAMLQTAAATPAFASGNHTDYYNLKDDVLDDGFDIIDGMAAVPQSPGLGVRVDRRKVERRQGA